MKMRQIQFGVRENTVSSRQHASRTAVSSDVSQSYDPSTHFRNHIPPSLKTRSHECSQEAQDNVEHSAATAGGENTEPLLSVRDVGRLLQVPVSWVYGRMRKRSREPLPAYRLGKYWRFQREEVLAWVESQRRDSHAA